MSTSSYPIRLGKSFFHRLNPDPQYMSQIKFATEDAGMDATCGVMSVNTVGTTALSTHRSDTLFSADCLNFQGHSADHTDSAKQFVLLFDSKDKCYYIEHQHYTSNVRPLVRISDIAGLALDVTSSDSAVNIDDSATTIMTVNRKKKLVQDNDVDIVKRARGRPKSDSSVGKSAPAREKKIRGPRPRKPQPTGITEICHDPTKDFEGEINDLFDEESEPSSPKSIKVDKLLATVSRTEVEAHEDRSSWKHALNMFEEPPIPVGDDILGDTSIAHTQQPTYVYRTHEEELDDIFASDNE